MGIISRSDFGAGDRQGSLAVVGRRTFSLFARLPFGAPPASTRRATPSLFPTMRRTNARVVCALPQPKQPKQRPPRTHTLRSYSYSLAYSKSTFHFFAGALSYLLSKTCRKGGLMILIPSRFLCVFSSFSLFRFLSKMGIPTLPGGGGRAKREKI